MKTGSEDAEQSSLSGLRGSSAFDHLIYFIMLTLFTRLQINVQNIVYIV